MFNQIKKNYLLLVLTTVIICFVLVGCKSGKDNTSDEILNTVVTGEYRDGGVEQNLSDTARYNDNYFLKGDSSKENRGLAKMSMLASASVYNKNYTEGKEDKIGLIQQCGFADNHKYYLAKTTWEDNDKVSFEVAYKKVNGTVIVAVWIKGTGSMKKDPQWASNAKIYGAVHHGFCEAEKYMNKIINSYLQNDVRLDKSGKTKFWITGHSRGAAIANLYAKRMNKKIGKKNVFAYTFASPKVAVVDNNLSKIIESNIYNYCNKWDYVTMAPPYYGRYGKDKSIHLNRSRKGLFRSITGIEYNPVDPHHNHSQTAYLVCLSSSKKVKTTKTNIIKKDGYWKENGEVTKVEYSGNRFTYYAPLSCGSKGYYEAPSVGYKKGKKTFEVDKNCECSIEIFRDTPPTKKMKTKEFMKKFKKYANLDGGLFLFEVKNGKIINMTVNVYG